MDIYFSWGSFGMAKNSLTLIELLNLCANSRQAEQMRTRLQDLEKLLAHFDCRGRSGKRHPLLKYPMARLHEHGDQGEDALPNALEDFLAFQGNSGQNPPRRFHSARRRF